MLGVVWGPDAIGRLADERSPGWMQGHRTGISPDFWCRGGRRRSNAGEMVYRFVEFASVTLEFRVPLMSIISKA